MEDVSLPRLEARADAASRLLAAMANPKRLIVLSSFVMRLRDPVGTGRLFRGYGALAQHHRRDLRLHMDGRAKSCS